MINDDDDVDLTFYYGIRIWGNMKRQTKSYMGEGIL
jgi:hypothetical protein